MNEPVILKHSFGVAFLTLLQLVVPAIVAAGCLYAVNAAYGMSRNSYIDLLAIFAVTLLLLLPRQRRTTETAIFGRRMPLAYGVVARWLVTLGILLIIGFSIKVTESYSRRVVVTWAIVTAPLIALAALVLDQWMRRILGDPANARNAVFVGLNAVSIALAKQLRTGREYCMEVVGFFDDRSADRLNISELDTNLLGRLQDLAAYANDNNVQVIFIALPMRHLQRVRDLLDELRDTTASIYYVPDIFVLDLIQSRTGEISGMPVVALCETPFYGMRGVVKRLTDVVISTMALLLLLPFLLAIAILVKVGSSGPAIFRQRRYGLDGREIVVYKFRTMTVTQDGGAIVQATRDDIRITPVGRILRRYSVDELPQLFNVLQGRMSLVGPRPHAVAHNEEYRKLIKGYMVRHKVKPGITGLAQVNGCRGETLRLEEMEARIKYDLDYLRNWSPTLDLRILFATAIKIFVDKRAY
jgi:putative colanic acid biosynthesis UDP-glucose lipid carrier transferase